jgi:hypothetical protein
MADTMDEHRRDYPGCGFCASEAADDHPDSDEPKSKKESRIAGFWKGKALADIVADFTMPELALSGALQDVVIDWGLTLEEDSKERTKAFDHLAKAIAWARLGGLDKP